MDSQNNKKSEHNRREFIKLGAVVGLTTALSNVSATGCNPKSRGEARTNFQVPPIDPVRMGSPDRRPAGGAVH